MISGPASVKAEPPVAMDAWHWVHGNPWFLLTRQDLECPVPLLQRQCHLRRMLLDLEREQLPATKLETDDEGLVVRRIAQ